MAQLEQLIPVINKLQDVFTEVGVDFSKIDLPQIAVVGAQSSGKSSVLENIVGRDFLPRGSGIVTRRPLVLQLVHIDKGEPYGVFLHKPKEKFTDFNKIRTEIESVTDQEASGKGVSANPINLKVFATNVIQLTLIDLPGITKVAVEGQPEDIERQIRNMLMTYVTKKNCIILAVTAANQDIANSDALQMAREVDPSGDRTLGVLTKLDLMDEGTDCRDVLDGKVIPLKKGYVGVVNRSQKDIEGRKDIQDALKAEQQYFTEHPAYNGYAKRMGTPFLARQLNTILMQHIRATLPELKSMINGLVLQTQGVLKANGWEDTDLNEGALLLNLLTKYTDTVLGCIDGRGDSTISKNEIVGGARINYIFHQAFGSYIESMSVSSQLSDENIRTIIDNAKGTRSALFLPEDAFELLVRNQVGSLEDPCVKCCEFVYDELLKMCSAAEKEFGRFPELRMRVNEKVKTLLLDYVERTKEFVKNLIQIELAYVNTKHPNFYGGGMVFDQLMARERQKAEHEMLEAQKEAERQRQRGQAPPTGAQHRGPPPDLATFSEGPVGGMEVPDSIKADQMGSGNNLNMEVRVIKDILIKYFEIVQVSMRDKVPKSIMCFLVNHLKRNMRNELVAEFYKDDLFDALLKESDEAARKRAAAKKMLKACLKAQATLNEVGSFRVS